MGATKIPSPLRGEGGRASRVRTVEAFIIGGGVAGFLLAEEEMLKRVQHDSLILVRHDNFVWGRPKFPLP